MPMPMHGRLGRGQTGACRMRAGAPTLDEYDRLLASEPFHAMEQFSDPFLARHHEALRDYARRWVADPLHQWSRQWEYPFVFNRIAPQIEGQARVIRLLDAGSGITFFPYYLAAHCRGRCQIHCCDLDESLGPVFAQINARDGQTVAFAVAPLQQLPYADGQFDLIYCVSVLEHTDDYDAVVAEFTRLLAPGGRLVVTFDISLDGTGDIPLPEARALLATLSRHLEPEPDVDLALTALGQRTDLLTTGAAAARVSGGLPWKYPSLLYQIRALSSGRGFIPWPPEYAVFCLALTKRVDR